MKILILIFCLLFFATPGYSNSENNERDPLPCLNKKFTIVAHIVRDSLGLPNITESSILSNISAMNNYFSDICVSFEVCEFRYIDNFQYDTLVQASEWPQIQIDYSVDNRINMFFVEHSDIVASFASLGGIANLTGGGIVMLKASGVFTYTHEMGHYFGLEHTFAGAGTPTAELVDGSNCLTAGDGICDTPADPFIEDTGLSIYQDTVTCEYTYMGTDSNGDYYVPYVGNIMSYYHNNCKCGFTYDQYLKMANTYLNSNPKMW